MTKNASKRIYDIARIKIARGDLMQHWRKQNEILATDQRYFYVRAARKPFVEVHCRVKPGKPATGNHDASLFHLPNIPIVFSKWRSLSNPETDKQNQDKRRQNEPRDHNDLDSQF